MLVFFVYTVRQNIQYTAGLVCFFWFLHWPRALGIITPRLEAWDVFVNWEFNGLNELFVNGSPGCSAIASIALSSATPMIARPTCTTPVIHMNPCDATLWGNKRQAAACLWANLDWGKRKKNSAATVSRQITLDNWMAFFSCWRLAISLSYQRLCYCRLNLWLIRLCRRMKLNLILCNAPQVGK